MSATYNYALSHAKQQTAAPPAPPKQFTDEELKQKYGIHLATRLESEDATEQKAKWADIDEDEEEWTPETVEWMDGTKTTISHADAVPSPQVQEKPLEKPQEELPPAAPAKPTMTALKRPGLAAQTRTILRPGAAQQAKQIGADGKATPDSKSPMLKNTAPAPIKSPWAPLPPVEKASPVAIHPTPVAQPPRFAHRDSHGFDAMAPQQQPAREIATDTFDRSWKDSERTNRELFNSQSGRYEPAPEHRRGSRQQDHFHRQPAVLQRPSPQSGPAEPSAAFQARTSSQTDGSPWGRRRGSSISGNVLRDRRMSSSSKVFDPAEPSPEAVPEAKASAEVQPFAASTEAQMHQTDGPAPSALSIAEEREKQKKLMQEKREAAVRRRQEEEAREEAERRERIRKKMEALGMPLEKTTSQEKAEKVQLEKEKQKQPAEVTSAAVPEASPEKAPAAQPVAPKVEQQQARTETHVSPAKQLSPRKEKTVDPSLSFNQNPTSITRPAPKSLSSPQLPGLQQHSPNGPTRSPYQQSSLTGMTASSFSSPGDQKAQPARLPSISSGDSFTATPWGSASMTSHTAPSSNLWGPPPTNNRHIGNGTFEAGYSSISPGSRQQSQNAPFSTPFSRPYPPSRVSPKNFGQPGPAQTAPMDQQYAPLSTMDSRMNESSGASALAGTSPLPEPARLVYPAPIAPPQKAAPRQQSQRDTSAWTNFAMTAQARDARAKEDAQSTHFKKHSPPGQNWTVSETFKQTRPGDDRWLEGSRTVANTHEIVRDAAAPPHRPGAIGQMVSGPQSPGVHQSMNHQPPPGGEQLHMPGEGIVRLPTGPSNFSKSFGSPGNVTTGVRLPPLAAYAGNVQPLPVQPSTPGSAPQQSRFFPSALYGGSPPPEESDHPVCGGDSKHPHVNLPTPKPKVKLPPVSADRPQPSPVTMPRSVHSFTVGARPLVQTSDWQARFNGLFGRAQVTTTIPPSPPKTPPKTQTPAPAVASVSRISSDAVLAQSATTVSLPRSASPVSTYTKVVSKPGVDDIFDGELSFGSTPRVFLPRGATYQEPPANTSTPSRANSRSYRPVDSQSKRIWLFPDNSTRDITVYIKFPKAWSMPKEVTLPRKNKPQGHKNSARPSNKLKRNASSNTVTESPNPTMPSATGSIINKPQSSPAAADKSVKAPLAENTAISSSNTEIAGPKKTVWPKVPKAPRGRGSGYYKSRA